MVAGTDTSNDNPFASPSVDASQALSGSGLSLTLQESEFLLVKENCPFEGQSFRLLSVSLTLRNAQSVLVLATGDMLRAEAMVCI